MPNHDIFVIGTSAGGVEALKVLVAGFPPDMQAAVFVAMHIGAGSSYLPEILTRAGPLKAIHPADGENITAGKIYVAPPDHHLLVSTDHVHLSRGPRENRTRPAINPLFRSAAKAYQARVVGVILTGLLDDGVAGLAEIKRRGGIAIAQDPGSALFPSMPSNAIQRVNVDYVVPLDEIATLASQLTMMQADGVGRDEPMEHANSQLTCPECRGPLARERQGNIVEYRCRVGHAYSPLAMAAEHDDTVERSIWASIVALEEAADIADMQATELEPPSEDAEKRRRQAALLKNMLTREDL